MAIAGLMAVACGGRTAPTPTATTVPTPVTTASVTPVIPDRTVTATPATPSATATAAPPRPQARGGTLRTAVPTAPSHYDVHRDASPALVQWGPGIVYSRLLRFRTDPGAPTPNGEVVCDLCESWAMDSPTSYRINLRADVAWQDMQPVSGRAVTAADVLFSLRRQTTSGWPNAPLLSSISSMDAVGERTVAFTLARPDPEFLERLADGHSRIVSPEAVEVTGDLLSGPSIGTGPWELLEASESAFRYVANPDYFEPGIPYADFLEVGVLPAADVRAAALRTHTVDLVMTGAQELGDALARFPELRWAKTLEPGAGLELAINTKSPPFDSLDARRAVFYALDPWRDAAEVWAGGALPTAGLPVPALSWVMPADAMRGYLARPAEAADLAARAQLAGTAVQVTVGEFGDRYVAAASRIADDLASIGLVPTVTEVTTRQYGDDVWFGGHYQIAIGAEPPVSSLSEYLLAVHHSRGAWNSTGYSSAGLDALIENQAKQSDPASRRFEILDVQAAVLAGASRFSPATLYTQWAWWPTVRGFTPNTYRGESFFLATTALSGQ